MYSLRIELNESNYNWNLLQNFKTYYVNFSYNIQLLMYFLSASCNWGTPHFEQIFLKRSATNCVHRCPLWCNYYKYSTNETCRSSHEQQCENLYI